MNSVSLNQELKLQQTLSPQMLQSLALLPMPIMDLKDYINREIESNPALEIPESSVEQLPTDSYDPEASDRKESFLENIAQIEESLSEHLLKQLGESFVSDTVYDISQLLIGNLDTNGFFIVPLTTLFEKTDFKQEDIDTALDLVQHFDPFGICVKDFRESLILQAKLSGMADSDVIIFSDIVNKYLEMIKNSKNKEVASALKITEDDLNTYLSILTSFTPYPGRVYDQTDTVFIVPEFSVHNIDNTLVLEINKANLPKLEISKDFSNLVNNSDKETYDYVSSSLKQAKNLISQVEMRYQTLSKAATEIVELQKEFFFNGPRYLKTLTLKEVADRIGVHETTMSRLAQNKYVETDWGIFQLKYFFSQGVTTTEGSSISRNAIKDMIEEIKKNNPKLSAQKISDMLSEKGINCARRTVAKYLSEL